MDGFRYDPEYLIKPLEFEKNGLMNHKEAFAAA